MKIHSLDDNYVNLEFLVASLVSDGYVSFVSSRTMQRKMSRQIESRLGVKNLYVEEISSCNWPTLIYDSDKLSESEFESIKLEVQSIDNKEC